MSIDARTAEETPRLRAAFAALSRDAVPTEDCPPAEHLWSAARGTAAAKQMDGGVRELVEHVATCGACAEAWRLVRELEPAEAAGEVRTAARSWWRQPASTAVAAAAVVVLALGLTWRQPAVGPADTFRDGVHQQVQRIPEDGGTLDRRQPVLDWEEVENASYHLVVMTDDLRTVVDVRDLQSSEYRIPDRTLLDLPAGAELMWSVEVETPEGSTALPTAWFTLR